MATIPLSPIDHVFTGSGAYPVQFLFAYEAHIDAGRLKASLEEVLEDFPAAKSRLAPGNSYSYLLEESREPVAFEVEKLDHQPDIRDQNRLGSLFHPVESFPGEPLLRVRVNQGPRGTLLAVSISHCVVDGYSYFLFMSAWAQKFHRQASPKADNRRELLIPSEDKLIKDGMTGETLWQGGGGFSSECRPPISEQKLDWTIHEFSKARLKALVAEGSKSTDVALSENDVLVASFAKEFFKSAKGNVYIACPVDYRRTHGQLSPLYFGNAVRIAGFEVDADELRRRPLGEVAVNVRRAVRAIDRTAAEKSLIVLESWRKQHGLSSMEKLHVVHPTAGLLITNLSRLPLQALDFGAGAPYDARIVTPAVRTGVVLPTAQGIEVHLAMPK